MVGNGWANRHLDAAALSLANWRQPTVGAALATGTVVIVTTAIAAALNAAARRVNFMTGSPPRILMITAAASHRDVLDDII
jgi:hypothetical protein